MCRPRRKSAGRNWSDGQESSFFLGPNGWAGINGAQLLTSSGGALSGSLAFANATWNLVGDDAYIGDHNVAGCIAIKSNNNTDIVGILFVNQAESVKRPLCMDNFGNLLWNGTPIHNIVSSWSDGSNWYRKYSDGFIIQGVRVLQSAEKPTITLPCPFSNSNYIAVVTSHETSSTSSGYDYVITKTNTTIQVLVHAGFSDANDANHYANILLCGY